MKPNSRSTMGALLMLAVIPVFVGLLACMPVPIGNPERSSIDPEISGIWVWEADGESGELYLFQPYDKRTWLMIGVALEEGAEYVGDSPELDSAEQTFRALASGEVSATGFTATNTIIFKAWLTRLGGKQFMTWEPVGGFAPNGSHLPEFWWVLRLEKRDRDHFDVYMVNGEHEVFEDIRAHMKAYEEEHEFADEDEYLRYLQKMRPKWERALGKVASHVDDEDLYEETGTFTRLPQDLTSKASELFREVIEFSAE